jgi:hypothetical protein
LPISIEKPVLGRVYPGLLVQPMVYITLIGAMVCIGKDWVSKYWICDVS